MATLLDSYHDSSPESIQAFWVIYPELGIGSSYSALGQCFKPNLSYKITSSEFEIRKYGTPTGTLKSRLYLMGAGTYGDGGKPSLDIHPTITTPLAVSDAVNIDDVGSSFSYIAFTFSGAQQYVMTAEAAYVIVIMAESGSTFDGNNYIELAGSSGGSHDGNCVLYFYDNENRRWGGYSSAASRDRNFKVYGDPSILDVESEMKIFPDNVSEDTTAQAIEDWLDGLSIITVRKLNIEHVGGFYRVIVVYE